MGKKNWSLQVDNDTSSTWKMILKARQESKGLLGKQIVNGNDTNLRMDPWIHGHLLADTLG